MDRKNCNAFMLSGFGCSCKKECNLKMQTTKMRKKENLPDENMFMKHKNIIKDLTYHQYHHAYHHEFDR